MTITPTPDQIVKCYEQLSSGFGPHEESLYRALLLAIAQRNESNQKLLEARAALACQPAYKNLYEADEKELDRLAKELDAAREVLQWYASPNTIAFHTTKGSGGTYTKDNGERAREALQRIEGNNNKGGSV